MSGMRRLRHCLVRTPSSDSAIGAERVAPSNEAKPPLRFAGLILDLDARTLARESGEPIRAHAAASLALLRVFATRPGRGPQPGHAVERPWRDRRFEPFDRSVDMQVCKAAPQSRARSEGASSHCDRARRGLPI